MSIESIKDDQWVWVVVQDPGGSEQFLGQRTEEKDISFIPAFLEKEEALHGLPFLAREKGHKYEVQAVIYEDIVDYSAKNGFLLFILNSDGEVLKKIAPVNERGNP